MRRYRLLVGVLAGAITALLLTNPLPTLIAIDLGYLASIPVCYRITRRVRA
jgi:hypothetical protein